MVTEIYYVLYCFVIDNEGYTCSGTVRNLARFADEFPKHVCEEEKKAIEKMTSDERINKSNKLYE